MIMKKCEALKIERELLELIAKDLEDLSSNVMTIIKTCKGRYSVINTALILRKKMVEINVRSESIIKCIIDHSNTIENE